MTTAHWRDQQSTGQMSLLQPRCYLCGEENLGPQHQYNYDHFEPFFCSEDHRTAFHVVMSAALFDDQGVMLMPLDKLKVPKKVKKRVKQARRAAVQAGRKASRAAKKAGGSGTVVEGSGVVGGGRGGSTDSTQQDGATTIVINTALTTNWFGTACCEGCRQGKHCRDHCDEEEDEDRINNENNVVL